MGTFYVKCKIENPVDRDRSAIVTKTLVDTGSEFSWISGRTLEKIGIRREKKDIAFVLANGQQVTRSVGFAIIRIAKFFTIDEVVFAEPSDLQLLGARTLEGLNLCVAPGEGDLWQRGLYQRRRRRECVELPDRCESANLVDFIFLTR